MFKKWKSWPFEFWFLLAASVMAVVVGFRTCVGGGGFVGIVWIVGGLFLATSAFALRRC